MATTIELCGIKAEVPEGHEDFKGELFWCHILSPGTFTHVWQYISLTEIFASDSMTSRYWQRRVCDAARCYWTDYAIEHAEDHKTYTEAYFKAGRWQRIGEAAGKGEQQ